MLIEILFIIFINEKIYSLTYSILKQRESLVSHIYVYLELTNKKTYCMFWICNSINLLLIKINS